MSLWKVYFQKLLLQIDVHVLSIISDDKLQNYLPKYGDRIAVTSFAKKEVERLTRGENKTLRKQELAENIRAKIMSGTTRELRSQKAVGNRNAQKEVRRVEVGWISLNPCNQKYMQIYEPSGGGIKHVTYPVDTKLAVVMDDAKGWFFPGGRSRRGDVNDFELFMTDSTHEPIDLQETVENRYNVQKQKLLRLYLASKNTASTKDTSNGKDEGHESELELPPMKKPKRRVGRKVLKLEAKKQQEETKVEPHESEDELTAAIAALQGSQKQQDKAAKESENEVTTVVAALANNPSPASEVTSAMEHVQVPEFNYSVSIAIHSTVVLLYRCCKFLVN